MGFLRYCLAKAKEKSEELLYKVYITDTLRACAARIGVQSELRYYDLLTDKAPETSAQAAENAKNRVFAEFERIGGARNGNKCA